MPPIYQGNLRWSYYHRLVSLINFTIHLDVHNYRCSVWYFAAAHKHYDGPKSNLNDDSVTAIYQDFPTKS